MQNPEKMREKPRSERMYGSALTPLLSVSDSGALLEGAKWPKAQERVFWYSLEAKVAWHGHAQEVLWSTTPQLLSPRSRPSGATLYDRRSRQAAARSASGPCRSGSGRDTHGRALRAAACGFARRIWPRLARSCLNGAPPRLEPRTRAPVPLRLVRRRSEPHPPRTWTVRGEKRGRCNIFRCSPRPPHRVHSARLGRRGTADGILAL